MTVERYCITCALDGTGGDACIKCFDGASQWRAIPGTQDREAELSADVERWKATARKMAAEARWWRRRRERQLSHIDRAKEEVARQRHRGLRHWAKWVQRGQQLESVTAQRDAARAEIAELLAIVERLMAGDKP